MMCESCGSQLPLDGGIVKKDGSRFCDNCDKGHVCLICHERKPGNKEPGMFCAECYLISSSPFGSFKSKEAEKRWNMWKEKPTRETLDYLIKEANGVL